MKTATFWHCSPDGKPFKVEINQGETQHHHYSGPTDEGKKKTIYVFTFASDLVTLERQTDGVDCDGRLTRDGAKTCPVAELAAGLVVGDIAYPKWVDENLRKITEGTLNYED